MGKGMGVERRMRHWECGHSASGGGREGNKALVKAVTAQREGHREGTKTVGLWLWGIGEGAERETMQWDFG